jgi:hypothetical protein
MKFCFALLLTLSTTIGCTKSPSDYAPGERAFDAANAQIQSGKEGYFYGEDEAARALAKSFSEAMNKRQAEMFTGGKKNRAFSLTKEKFVTYCKIGDGSVVILSHVPQFKRYKGEVRDTLNQLAWLVAVEATASVANQGGVEIAVGLRGSAMYGGSAVGLRGQEPRYQNKFSVGRDMFYKYFKEAAAPTTKTAGATPAPDAPAKVRGGAENALEQN